MPEVTRFAPGHFCWTELMTTDIEEAKRFYGQLFGWQVDDQPMGEGQYYSMFQVKGKNAAGGYAMGPEQRAQGMPSNWGLYVAVDSAYESASKAKAIGGRVLMEPFDVMDSGRMATIQDPTGAVISLWEAKRSIGGGIVAEPGAVTWNELMTTDTNQAARFYSQLFGWEAQSNPMPDASMYTIFSKDGEQVAGMMAKPENLAQVPSHWMAYFDVADCNDSVQKARALAAQVNVEPTDIPEVGRFAVLQDPQGAVFSILQPAQAAMERAAS